VSDGGGGGARVFRASDTVVCEREASEKGGMLAPRRLLGQDCSPQWDCGGRKGRRRKGIAAYVGKPVEGIDVRLDHGWQGLARVFHRPHACSGPVMRKHSSVD